MFVVHLPTLKSINTNSDTLIVQTTISEKEYSIKTINSYIRFEVPKYKNAMLYQSENDVCYAFFDKNNKKLFSILDSKLTQELISIVDNTN